MGLLDLLSEMSRVASEPGFATSATALIDASNSLPSKLDRIIALLESHDSRLAEISLGLDNLADPIARPRFRPADVEKMMDGTWPGEPTALELGKEARAVEAAMREGKPFNSWEDDKKGG